MTNPMWVAPNKDAKASKITFSINDLPKPFEGSDVDIDTIVIDLSPRFPQLISHPKG